MRNAFNRDHYKIIVSLSRLFWFIASFMDWKQYFTYHNSTSYSSQCCYNYLHNTRFIFTCHTWYIGCCFFLWLVTDISATVASIRSAWNFALGYIRTRTDLWARYMQIQNFGPKSWPFDRECLETVSCSVICQLELNISSTKAFYKYKYI